jgi:hypothetical protein
MYWCSRAIVWSNGLLEAILNAEKNLPLENPSLNRHITETASNETKAGDKNRVGGSYQTVVKNLINA